MRRNDAGYVTVEAAMALTALTVVAAVIVAGLMTVASYLGAMDLARDAARAAALDPANATSAAQGVVAEADRGSTVSVDAGEVITVRVTRDGRLFDVSATASIIAEPQDSGW